MYLCWVCLPLVRMPVWDVLAIKITHDRIYPNGVSLCMVAVNEYAD